MNNAGKELHIYLMPQAIAQEGWQSLLGDKFRHSLNFSWDFTDDLDRANVVVWDGLISPKATYESQLMLERFKQKKMILILQHTGRIFFTQGGMVKEAQLEGLETIDLPAGNLLPEDLLLALTTCYGKLEHV